MMNCPLCEATLLNKSDEYYYICSGCGAYVKDETYYPCSDKEKARYEEHNNDVNNVHYQKFTSPITDAIIKDYKAHHSGLDYGCGTGPVISKMLQDKNYNVQLYDPFFHPDEAYLNKKYDYIFLCEVLEHFHHPKKEIIRLLGLLKDGGRLYIMTHIYDGEIPFEKWYYRNDTTHVFICTEKTIRYIQQNFSLRLLKQDERLIIFQKQ